MINQQVRWLVAASLTTACISDDGSKDDDDGADTGAVLEEALDPGTADSRAGCTVSAETDVDADGSVDRLRVQTWHEQLAPDDSLMEISYHEESEGYVYDSTKEWDTDLGCLVALDIVEVVEGVESQRRYRYECDAQNWRTSRTYEALRDGEWVLLERESWDRQYDAEGNRIRELNYLERLVDDPGEEWFLGEWVWEGGNFVQYDAYTGEGLTPYYTSTYTYEGDRIISEVLVLGEYFEGSVGDLYRTTEWSYDTDGNTLSQRTDYSESGDVVEETWEYDAYARDTVYTLYDSDAND
ncbi:MAG TPA: hypothetical protein DFR83_25130, partial [Deltaproteobacteria bacterium]|nr:hypothetical protein [Deltaproteobacteria bacterium]